MLAVADDQPGAFQRLVDQYQGYIARCVGRYVRDRTAVEDLTQEVLLRVYRARGRYQPTAHFEAFLQRIVLNLCVNHSRYTRRRRTASLNDVGQDGNALGEALSDERASSPTHEADLKERARLVRRAIRSLPVNQRKAIVLSGFHGLANTEVAESIGLSGAAVKSLLWRGRENLAKRLRSVLIGDDSGRPDGAAFA
ncbi:MAG TPA: sigma-70 family RNA polymerase sigma factor [Planctomycetota bacterium]|nr:sigma-70 family RNA polymerase sigma factor [Planctomycetota bacterium]